MLCCIRGGSGSSNYHVAAHSLRESEWYSLRSAEENEENPSESWDVLMEELEKVDKAANLLFHLLLFKRGKSLHSAVSDFLFELTCVTS